MDGGIEPCRPATVKDKICNCWQSPKEEGKDAPDASRPNSTNASMVAQKEKLAVAGKEVGEMLRSGGEESDQVSVM